MPTIRAYTFADRIIVKYYDNGQGEILDCPNCNFSGKVDSQPNNTSELFCPNCETMLASQSFIGAKELQEEKSKAA